MRLGDLDALKKTFESLHLHPDLIELIDNAPTVPQINILCENADEKAIADMKEELQKVIDDLRPQGEWIYLNKDEPMKVECPFCHERKCCISNYCDNCGADMRGNENEPT